MRKVKAFKASTMLTLQAVDFYKFVESATAKFAADELLSAEVMLYQSAVKGVQSVADEEGLDDMVKKEKDCDNHRILLYSNALNFFMAAANEETSDAAALKCAQSIYYAFNDNEYIYNGTREMRSTRIHHVINIAKALDTKYTNGTDFTRWITPLVNAQGDYDNAHMALMKAVGARDNKRMQEAIDNCRAAFNDLSNMLYLTGKQTGDVEIADVVKTINERIDNEQAEIRRHATIVAKRKASKEAAKNEDVKEPEVKLDEQQPEVQPNPAALHQE